MGAPNVVTPPVESVVTTTTPSEGLIVKRRTSLLEVSATAMLPSVGETAIELGFKKSAEVPRPLT